ncbi:MAG: DNA recombination protein RmuC [Bacteroidales bacterium]|nr:DNA recombination protein RmuC [Bacteroidales bacterium]
MMLYIIIAAVAAALVAWALTHFIAKANYTKEIARLEGELNSEKTLREHEAQVYDKTLSDLKENQKAVIEATKNELALENEKRMKAREESIKKEAAETIKNITDGLDKNIKEMKESFDAQKKAHAEDSASIKTKFEETVTNLQKQTESIGNQADDLAKALKGQNKMQGIFGETILENILKKEGLTPGRDYDAEFYLRDRKGNIIQNEETGRKMRPDFALHFPDNTDVLLDSKVSLTALADYYSAETDEQRKDASKRNLDSILSHIAELTSKEYQKYVEGRTTLEYVIMFIPNYGAYQLAKMEDPDIFAKAFKQNVLITTEETLIPFLRLIRTAWVQKDQLDNMADIVAGAQKMVDRVALFCEKNAEVGNAIERASKLFEENQQRLVSGRQSIAKAAQEVIDAGVKLTPGKVLPEVTE